MSAPESAAAVPVVEDAKPAEMPVVEEVKVEEPAAVAEGVSPAVEAEGTADKPMVTEEVKDEAEKKDAPPKSPSFLTKLLNGFKGEKKVKGPKKEKKKEEVEATATMEAPMEVPAAEVPAAVAEVPVETVKEAEAVVTAPEPAVVAEEVKMETPPVQKPEGKALKVTRRLSARVGDFFKQKPKAEVHPPAKVDELPPMIGEPVKVAPLENPASEAAKVEEPAKTVEVVAPVVAATA